MSKLSPEQCRAARALLNISQDELAIMANVRKNAVAHFESGEAKLTANNLASIASALTIAGVDFIPENGGGAGVKLAKKSSKGRSRGR